MKSVIQNESKLRSTVSPRTLIIIGTILLILYTGFAVFEYNQSKKDLISMMQKEGYILLDALMVSSEQSILEYDNTTLSGKTGSGPGMLIKTIMQRKGIVYIALQDDYSTLMASENLPDLDPILMDPFLLQISIEQTKDSRILETDTGQVFEIAGSFFFNNDYIGIFRVGLEMDQYLHTLQNIRLRFIITALIFLFIGLTGFSYIVANQNATLLSESYQRVQTYTGEILQNLKDAVIAVDQTGKVTVFNDAAIELFEISADKIARKSLFDIKFPCLAAITETLKTGNTVFNNQFILNRSNQRKILSLATSIVRNQNGEIETVILIATDKTLQNQLEEQLQRREKLSAMGELASGVAHEIRNPINAIGMVAQRLKKEFRPTEVGENQAEFDDLTSSVVAETKRINQTIQQFLQFAKPLPLQKKTTEMKHFLNEIGQFFKSSADPKSIKFIIKIKDPIQLAIDPVQMKQVLLNLLQNSLDATPENGQIILSAKTQDDHYEISVSDTGDGIPAENQKRIFDIYFTTKRDGTGMGLPIVNQIVQQHDGEIIVESEIGHGTTFRIRLPIRENQ